MPSEAALKLLMLFFERSKKSKIFDFSVPCKILSLSFSFSQTHRPTQRKHFWIDLDEISWEKLVPGETNSQILRYFDFSERKLQTCMRAVNRQPMFTARGTRRAFSLICCPDSSALHVRCEIQRSDNDSKMMHTTSILVEYP